MTDVPDIDSAIWTDVRDIGAVLELKVTGFDNVVRIDGGIYVAIKEIAYIYACVKCSKASIHRTV